MDSFQYAHVSFALESLNLLPVLCLMKSRICLVFLADRVHCWLMSNLVSTSTSRSFSAELLSISCPQHVLVHKVVCPQMQDFTLLVHKLCEVPINTFIQHVTVPLDDSTVLCHIGHSSCFLCHKKIAEGTVCAIAQIINNYALFEYLWMPWRVTNPFQD